MPLGGNLEKILGLEQLTGKTLNTSNLGSTFFLKARFIYRFRQERDEVKDNPKYFFEAFPFGNGMREEIVATALYDAAPKNRSDRKRKRSCT